ncbi:G-patch domain and KOW motifs-containing protein [Aricia agestis]|uniref:G-patch domain and KOW motifs-containing protein n=1 Tax=Aricia agestis TaxID=91739 RepID=UPI001C202C46|nr:G-patch domain and KOW motifs-containing protein [Aricia agestis]
MEPKKISFGFMKTKKSDKPAVVEKKDYIECVEEKSIKVIGGDDAAEKKPLVIPMKPNTLITAEKLREIAEKVENFDDVKFKTEEPEKKVNVPENETLEQMAARELLEEAKKEIVVDIPNLVVPINTKPIFDGQTESTIDDYESVPVQEFGLAMLRGMGWTQGKESTYKQPQLRPKGLGLGADKVITDKKKNNTKDKEEELQIVKNSYVKVTTGKHSGYYGKVVSLDEDNGRIVVELAIKKETVSLSEFMVQAVPKSVYDKESKVINTESYEEYKRKENIQKSSEVKKEKSSSSKNINRQEESSRKEPERHSNGNKRSRSRGNRRRDSYSSEEDRSRHRKKEKKKYSSNDSLSSSEPDRHKSGRRYSSDSSSSDDRRKYKSKKSSKEKRDIDKKRKGKKKKRDRDRSPNYRKHKK